LSESSVRYNETGVLRGLVLASLRERRQLLNIEYREKVRTYRFINYYIQSALCLFVKNDKININEKIINFVKNQFIYITSHLKGKRLQLTFIFITVNRDAFNIFATHLLNYLNSIFGDRYKIQRAVKILYTIKQSLREFFFVFYFYFKKALADAERIV
jgi:hypothetical protein